MKKILVAVPEGLRWDAAVQKSVHESLPYYAYGFIDANFGGDFLEVFIKDENNPDVALEASILSLIIQISSGFRDVRDRQLKKSAQKLTLAKDDPYAGLINKGSIVQTGHGKFVYRGDFLRVFQALDAKILAFCKAQGALEEIYPSTVKVQSLLDSGYLRSTPHLAYFVAPAHLDVKCLLELGSTDVLSETNRKTTVQNLGVPREILAPTVCYHAFESRYDTIVNRELVTAINKCYRHEPVNVRGLERLTTYWMRELMVFNDASSVERILAASLDWTSSLLDEFGVSYSVVTASDPFFSDMAAGKRMFQAAFDLKKEIKVNIFGGEEIAIASFNNHNKSLVSKFKIRSDTDVEVDMQSGCVGWGLERFIYGLYSQLGLDIEKWPRQVRESLDLF